MLCLAIMTSWLADYSARNLAPVRSIGDRQTDFGKTNLALLHLLLEVERTALDRYKQHKGGSARRGTCGFAAEVCIPGGSTGM